MTTPDPIRAALERLITMASDELTTPGLWAHSRATWNDDIAAARAALAAAPVGEPSDEALEELAELFNGDPVPAMRRSLELWGRPATPPAPLEGEVGELVELKAWLRSTGEGQPLLLDEGYARLIRTADLLAHALPLPATTPAGQERPMAELSPAAQAVLDAANGASSWGPDDCLNDAREIAAAALRAAADRVEPDDGVSAEVRQVLNKLLAIAAELESRHG